MKNILMLFVLVIRFIRQKSKALLLACLYCKLCILNISELSSSRVMPLCMFQLKLGIIPTFIHRFTMPLTLASCSEARKMHLCQTG